jgi:hypothetical protein
MLGEPARSHEAVLTESGAIPESVRELISRSVHSIEELEVLLVLRGPVMRSWTAAQLASELRLPEGVLLTALQALVVSELALQLDDSPPLQYQYRLQVPEAEEAVEDLAEIYAQNRVEVLMLISSNAIERVRKGALRTFSDAFRLRGRKKDG